MSLKEKIEALEAEVAAAVARTAEDVERFRVATLGRNGSVTALFEEFKQVASEEKREFGQRMNRLKQSAQTRWEELKGALHTRQEEVRAATDPTRPTLTENVGGLHPISIVRQRIIEVFGHIGYTVSQGPEIEDDHHNFGALNFAPDHPARDMQDTFFVGLGADREVVMRTHTSPVQIRVMEGQKPPIYSVMPGRVYRNEATDATHLAVFHQLECLVVDRGITFAHMAGTIDMFTKAYFGPGWNMRLRPAYFPFTEPSAEFDLQRPDGTWLELGGCGMVHPNVLRHCNLDPEEWSGFAFGFGLERMAMQRHGLDDIRELITNDVRFLAQF